MIQLGRREFPIPLWLWAALPLAAVLYVSLDLSLTSRGDLYYRQPDRSFLEMMSQLGTAALTAFLLADLVRRARAPWYGVPLLYAVSTAAAVFLVSDVIRQSLGTVTQFVSGAVMMLAASTRGAGGNGIVLVVATAIVPVLLAIAAALFITIVSRVVAALPLRSRDMWREFWANLVGAALWLMIAIGGYIALRSSYGLALGDSSDGVPKWLPYAGAGFGAIVATALHLLLVQRSRRAETAGESNIRVWLLAALCVASFAYRPDLFGAAGVRAHYDYIKPALRAAHLLPTPALVVAGYKIDVAFHDYKVTRGESHPAGGVSFVSAFFPDEYGLSAGKRLSRIDVYRRDARVSYLNPVWERRRKALEIAQTQKPDEDALVRFPTMVPAVALRTNAFPELEFQLSNFDSAVSWDVVEVALRRFLQERVRRIN